MILQQARAMRYEIRRLRTKASIKKKKIETKIKKKEGGKEKDERRKGGIPG